MKSDRIKTHIEGLDDLIEGGIPLSTSLLAVGGPGSGKTTLCAQFIYNGALRGEKGALVLIGQTQDRFLKDVSKLGINLLPLIKKGKVKIYELPIYDKRFDSNFSNLILELDSFAPKRIAMDSFSIFFSSIESKEIHKETIRLLKYLLKKSSLILTLEKHSEKINYPDEFFASDGVIDLGIPGVDGKERQLKILKMRQTNHPLDPFTFKIGTGGLQVISKPELTHPKNVSSKKMNTGIEKLDRALSGGFYEGTSILVAGNSGTGKTIMGLQFLIEGTKNNEKCLYISFEESEKEILRNISSLGWKLNKQLANGNLEFYTSYPETVVPDELIFQLNKKIKNGKYSRVVLDSISRLSRSMDADKYLDFLKHISSCCKSKMTTLMILGEVAGGDTITSVSEMNISSLVEGIILLKHVELLGEMKRSLMIVKLRGVNHDKKIKEFEIQEGGIHLRGDLKNMESLIPAVEGAFLND
jgi:circadian clock protein KaiC